MRSDGLFIGIEVDDDAAQDSQLAGQLAQVCPVDIYRQGADGAVTIVDENVDECVLCRLCLDVSPGHSVRVLKLYDGGAEL